MNVTVLCRNYFKDGKTDTTAQAYTAVWIRLINCLEQSGAILSAAR